MRRSSPRSSASRSARRSWSRRCASGPTLTPSPRCCALRDRGLKTIVVSNWDCSLGDVLERCGLAPLLDGAVSSAEAGHRKPDPGIFAPALELAGCEPAEALHVGDSPVEDGEGARAAGVPVLLIDREGGADISSLTEIEERLQA